MMHRASKNLLTLSFLLLAVGCSSKDLFASNRGLLESAAASIEQDDFEAADASLEQLTADTHPQAKKYALQRTLAFYLLSVLHLDAACGATFLTEPNQRGLERPSPTSHLLRSAFWSGKWLDEVSRADFSKAQSELPPDLQALGKSDLTIRTLLNLVVVNTRLGFDRLASELIEDLAFEDPAFVGGPRDCQEALEASGLDPRLHGYLHLALHRHFGNIPGIDNQSLAYQFGILAWEDFNGDDAAEARATASDIVGWITGHQEYRFESSRGTVFQEDLPYCPVSQEEAIDYVAVPKENGSQ